MPRPVITLLALTLFLLGPGATAADERKKLAPPPRKGPRK